MQFPLSFLLRIMYVLFVFRLYYFTRFFRGISFKRLSVIKCRRQDLTGFRVPGILETQSHDEYSRKIFRSFPFIHSVFR